MQVRGIEKDTQVLVRMNKGNYIVRTRRARRCRADGERCALDFNLATSFSFSFFFFQKAWSPSVFVSVSAVAGFTSRGGFPSDAVFFVGIYICICVYMCVYM